MGTRDDDRPASDPYDPLKRDLPSEALGWRHGAVQGSRHGRATRGMGYGPQTGSEAFGIYGRPPSHEPAREAPRGLEGGSGNLGNAVRYGSGRSVQSGTADYAGLASAGPRAAQRHYPRRDERIRDDIAERLYHSAHVDAGDVSVDVNDGIVTLEGSVPERRMKHEIENLAAGIRGVKDVENRVRVSRNAAAASGGEGAPSPRAIRGRTDADDIRGRPGTPEHEESLLDEGIEESFPASDTPSAVQPGSLAAEERSRRDR